MPLLVANTVEHDPQQENAAGYDCEAMTFKKRLPGLSS
jgi:hypothetical protein